MTIETYHNVINYLRGVIHGTEWEGYVYAVGGCCRDAVMGRPINDIDLAVNLPNGGIQLALWLHKAGLTIGHPVLFEKYGTAMLELNEFQGLEIEIVQTRRGKYTNDDDSELSPEAVFGSIREDAMRRDLTINTLFYDISHQRLLDLTGRALDDIKSHTLSTPMSPHDTLIDDPVRIIRNIRIAAALGWNIDDETMHQMRALAPELKSIKIERIRAEFEKMITGPNPVDALQMMAHCHLLGIIAPEFAHMATRHSHGNDGHTPNRREWHRILKALETAAPIGDPILAWAIMLTSLYENPAVQARNRIIAQRARVKGKKPQLILAPYERILRGLHHHSKMIKAVEHLLANANITANWGDNAEKATNKKLRNMRRMCSTPERFNRLMRYIHINNLIAPKPRPYQIPAILSRLQDIPN